MILNKKVAQIIEKSLYDIDKLLTKDLCTLQEELNRQIRQSKALITNIKTHQSKAHEKIDHFFEEVQKQIEIRKTKLKQEYDEYVEPEMEKAAKQADSFEKWGQRTGKMEL